jgi:DNA helicase-2/ATP-dependent DNA helicase PcrA
MTIHAAKGLEFPYVYLSGLEENLFPNTQMLASQMDLEEERRLFYVAVTRARHQLTLSHAHMRFRWGELTLCEPSRFMDEIDEKLLLGNTKKVSMPSFIPVQPLNNSGVKTKNSNNNSQPAPFNPPATPAKLKRLSDVSARQSKSTDVPSSNIKQGMKVSHKMFGAGTVMSIDGNGDNAKAVVQFDTVGQKTLMLRFAILTEISQ